MRLGDEAFGLAVRRDLTERTGRDCSVGAVYTALQRLEDKVLLRSKTGKPLPVRGGRARRHFSLTGTGARAVRDAERNVVALWSKVGQSERGTVLARLWFTQEALRSAPHVLFGDRRESMLLTVHEPVSRFDTLHPDQRFVGTHVRLAQGDTASWRLPVEAFWLKYVPLRADDAPPTIILNGQISCAPSDGLGVYYMPVGQYGGYCLTQSAGAHVTLAHGLSGASIVEGALALERAVH